MPSGTRAKVGAEQAQVVALTASSTSTAVSTIPNSPAGPPCWPPVVEQVEMAKMAGGNVSADEALTKHAKEGTEVAETMVGCIGANCPETREAQN